MSPKDQNAKDNLPSNVDIIKVLKNSNLTPSQKVSVITDINNKNQPSKSTYINFIPTDYSQLLTHSLSL